MNRFEGLIREIDPTLSLHYWDWTQDPQNCPDGQGGTVNLFTDKFMGNSSGEAGEPWRSNGFYNPNAPFTRSDSEFDPNNNPFDPPAHLTRDVSPGAPVTAANDTAVLNVPLYPDFWQQISVSHNDAHGFIGGTLSDPHTSFRDPFVFLLHSGLDRLFALWQLSGDPDVRLDPERIYGSDGNTTGSGDILSFADWGILSPIEPWAGPAAQNASTGIIKNVRATRPWAPPENEQNLPENQINHKDWTVVKPPCYDTNPTIVELLNPGSVISFNQVPTGETTIRAAVFRFISCYSLQLSVKTDPASPFAVFTSNGKSTTSGSTDGIWTEARMWFSFTAGPANVAVSPSRVEIHCETPNFSQDFTLTLAGTSIQRPKAAIVLALDQSGSMDEPAGTSGLRRIDALKYAARQFVEVVQPGNGVGLVRFDDHAYAPDDPTYPGLPLTVVGGGLFDPGRTAARSAVNAHATNPSGSTSIGAGILRARQVLDATAGWDVKGIIVFTDGLENTPPTISAVMNSIDVHTFAIGLGNPQQISTTALNAVTNATGGYLYVTGALNATDDDFFKLTKYFLQILAGVTNTDTVVDPNGFLPIGSEVRIPFTVADVDIQSTVVLSVDLPAASFYLITPAGQKITSASAPGSHVYFSDAGLTSIYRFTLPATIGSEQESVGKWQAVLRVDEKLFQRYCGDGPEHPTAHLHDTILDTMMSDQAGPTPCTRGGVRYNISIYAWSNLHLRANVYKDASRSDLNMVVRALLDEYDVPFGGGAGVVAHVTRPDRTNVDLSLHQTEIGVYEGSFNAAVQGLYTVHIVAQGSTAKGLPFSREAVLTTTTMLPQVEGGGGSSISGCGVDGAGKELCCLIKCLLRDEGVNTLLKEHRIDAEGLRKGVEECCTGKLESRR